MKQDDARKLDHTTLEEMRIRAVRSVQAGESPEVVARSMRINLLKNPKRCHLYEETFLSAKDCAGAPPCPKGGGAMIPTVGGSGCHGRLVRQCRMAKSVGVRAP